jgi:hypothetical protein
MTLTDALVLSAIITAFTLFAVVLAWGDHQTRGLNRNLGQKPQRRSEGNESIVVQSTLAAQWDDGKAVAESTFEREIVQI